MRHIESRRQRRQSKQGRQGTGKAGTYQVAYQTVGHLLSKRLREGPRSSERFREAPRGSEILRLREAPRSSRQGRYLSSGVPFLLSRAVIYKPYDFSCSCQASDHYIRLPHLCLCQTDIWKSFEMVRSGSGRKMHSDDGRMIKFMISFGSVAETCF